MNILPDSNYERIYTGSSIKASYLSTLLEDASIKPIIRDDQESARTSGFGMDYANGVKILVHKDQLLKAKHIVNSALDENGDVIAISEEQLTKEALNNQLEESNNSGKTIQKEPYKRSPLNLLLNAGLIILSLWRLSPLLNGESLSTLRIAVSSGIIIFCSWTLINHFRK